MEPAFQTHRSIYLLLHEYLCGREDKNLLMTSIMSRVSQPVLPLVLTYMLKSPAILNSQFHQISHQSFFRKLTFIARMALFLKMQHLKSEQICESYRLCMRLVHEY